MQLHGYVPGSGHIHKIALLLGAIWDAVHIDGSWSGGSLMAADRVVRRLTPAHSAFEFAEATHAGLFVGVSQSHVLRNVVNIWR